MKEENLKNSILLSVVFLGLVEIIYPQGAIDYYPLHVGDYWIQHSDSVSGVYQPTTFRQEIEGTDLIMGEEYYRRSNRLSADDGSLDGKWYTWVREDSNGIVIGAFGDTSIVDSAAIFDPPLLWLPNEIVNVGHAWDFDAPEMGGHFFFAIGSVSDTIEVPAGTFNDCIRIYGLIVDASGDSTQFSLFHYAPGIGEVSNNTYIVSGWYAQLELTEYSVLTSVHGDGITVIPTDFDLQQNYPNPFNPVTTIEFSLPTTGNTLLTIYNLRGEEVARLVDGTLSAGYHRIEWNATKFASGMYFYRLQVRQTGVGQASLTLSGRAGDFVQTRTMLLLK